MPREMWNQMKGWPVLLAAVLVTITGLAYAGWIMLTPVQVAEPVVAAAVGDICACEPGPRPIIDSSGEPVVMVGGTMGGFQVGGTTKVRKGESVSISVKGYDTDQLMKWEWLDDEETRGHCIQNGMGPAALLEHYDYEFTGPDGQAETQTSSEYTPDSVGSYTVRVRAKDCENPPSDCDGSGDSETETCDCECPSTWHTVTFEVVDRSTIEGGSPSLPADGESQTGRALTNPVDPGVVHEIIGDSHGARINRNTGVVTAGREPGSVTVRTTRPSRGGDDPDEEHVTIVNIGDCEECEGEECETGTGQAELDSVNFSISLGKTAEGKSAGKLAITSLHMKAQLGSPWNLYCLGSAEKIFDDNGLRQVLTATTLADVNLVGLAYPDSLTPAYTIDIYSVDAPPTLQESGVYSTSGATYVTTWRVSYNNDELEIIRGSAAAPDRKYEYYAGHTADPDAPDYFVGMALWSYSKNDQGTLVHMTTEELFWLEPASGETGWERTKVRTDHLNSHAAYTTFEIYHLHGEGDDVRAEFRGRYLDDGDGDFDSDDLLVTQFSQYYNESDPDDPQNGQREYAVYPDGSWTVWEYDSEGRVTKEITPWQDASINVAGPLPAASQNVAVEYSYGSEDLTEPTPAADDPRPRKVVRKVQDQIVSKTFYAYLMEGAASNELVEIVERATTPSAEYGDTGNLRTVTKYVADSDEQVASVLYPDGRWVSYEYTKGTYTIPTAHQPGTFTESATGAYLRTTARHGYDDNGTFTTVSGKSTREVVITDPAGHVHLRETWTDWSGVADRLEWTVREYDSDGHPTFVYSSDGTESETGWDCCHRTYYKDSTGSQTFYERDLSGRLLSSTKSGVDALGSDPAYAAQQAITTTYTYDARGNVLTTTREAGTGGSQVSLTSSREYDGYGRVTSDTNRAGLETTYVYDTTASGRQVTVTYPNNSTRVTKYHRDGRVESVTGTAVIDRYYTYGVETDGDQWTKVCIGSETSDRWEKVTYDMLGRSVKEERPGPASSETTFRAYVEYHHDDSGRLVRVSRTSVEVGGNQGGLSASIGDADTIYEYDELGNISITARDVNDNGTIDYSGNDRIAATNTQYVQYGGAWWLETMNVVFPTTGSWTSKLVGRNRRQVSGLGGTAGDYTIINVTESVNIHGDTTTRTTLLDRTNSIVKQVTDLLDSTTNVESITRNGLVQLSTSEEGITHTLGYDALGRQTTVTDPRTGTTTTTYGTDGRAQEIEDAAGNETTYAYYTTGDNKGLLKSVQKPLNKKAYYKYNERGQITNVWGHVPQPIEIGYNTFGQRTSLKTYRDGSNWAGTTWPTGESDDETTWTYDANTGAIIEKAYADGTHVDYTYAMNGVLQTRTWARRGSVTTTYDYNDATGELTSIDYSDSTPDVSFTYDRLGRMATVTDALGTRTFSYDVNSLQLAYEEIAGPLYDMRITRSYDDGQSGGVKGRNTGFTVGTAADPDADYATGYTYDDYGRMHGITGPGLPSYGARYHYIEDANGNVSNLVNRVDFMLGEVNIAGSMIRTYEANRDLLTSVENQWDASGTGSGPITTHSKYEYVNDSFGRRTSVVTTGTAFSTTGGDAHNVWQYNDRNELTGSTRREGTTIGSGTEMEPQRRVYDYDAIGNWDSATEGTGSPLYYCTNSVNQYVTTDDAIACPPGAGQETESFTYDNDGNMTQDGVYTYTYDAENRLVCVEPTTPATGDVKVESTYDYMGRRIRKVVTAWDASLGTGGDWEAVPESSMHFVYDGWNLIMELDGSATGLGGDGLPTYSNAAIRKYTWGLDLSGLSGNPTVSGIHGAGGIGGLLAAEQPTNSFQFVYFYDGNGNVGQAYNLTLNSLPARYEYDPYGNLVNTTGTLFKRKNPFRFSTKYFDKELDLHGTNDGLYYYGYRFYSPRLGRWVNRDPAGEMGDFLLSRFVGNAPTNETDLLGLAWNADIHFGQIERVAFMAGFDCYNDVAKWSNAVDTDPETAPVENGTEALNLILQAREIVESDPIRALELERKAEELLKEVRFWHFPADEDGVVRPNSMVARAESEAGLAECDLERFSRGLHILADSWSHQGKPYWRGIGHWRGVNVKVTPDGGLVYDGHTLDISGSFAAAFDPRYCHSTDNPKFFPKSTRDALMASFNLMQDFVAACECACPGGKPTMTQDPGRHIYRDTEVENNLIRKYPGGDLPITPYDER